VDDQRLTELETRYTYLERLVDELSNVVHEQQRALEAVSSRLKQLETLIADAMDQVGDRPPQEKPPHY
jgi:uncharacterized coiled-coil protein SlyX